MLSRGRIGSLIGGLGFILPGFVLILLFSWIYVDFGLKSAWVNASFRSMQPCIIALVFKAVHKIGEGAVSDHKTKELKWLLLMTCAISLIQSGFYFIFFHII